MTTDALQVPQTKRRLGLRKLSIFAVAMAIPASGIAFVIGQRDPAPQGAADTLAFIAPVSESVARMAEKAKQLPEHFTEGEYRATIIVAAIECRKHGRQAEGMPKALREPCERARELDANE